MHVVATFGRRLLFANAIAKTIMYNYDVCYVA